MSPNIYRFEAINLGNIQAYLKDSLNVNMDFTGGSYHHDFQTLLGDLQLPSDFALRKKAYPNGMLWIRHYYPKCC